MSESIKTGWPALTSALIQKQDLPKESIAWAMAEVMQGNASAISLAGFLVALQSKGVTVTELTTLAEVMLEYSHPISVPETAVDIVGTGGDGAHSVNISTMAALVVAGAGYPVVKHGNRAATSKSGSADVLEALGVKLDLPAANVARMAHEIGITFCFAQTFHPSMRFAVEARKALKIPTVFNVLGPLTNPGRVQANAIGIAFKELAPVIAGVFAKRGSSALVFRGADGLDELSIAGTSQVWEILDGKVHEYELTPQQLELKTAPLAALKGGDPDFNAQVVLDLLAGKTGAIRDAVVLNAAAGIVAAEGLNRSQESTESWSAAPWSKESALARLNAAARKAEAAIDSGSAKAKLTQWIEASQQAASN